MSASWTVRAATAADIDALVSFNAAMALETEDKALDAQTLRQGVLALLQREDLGHYLVVEAAAGQVAGSLAITFEWSDWRNGLFWWIQSVYVLPEHRRGGAFSALYREVERRARQTPGVCGIRLYVENENRPAQATYAALGMDLAHYRMFEVDFSAGAS